VPDELRLLRGADGVRLAVRAAGDPQAPPIVLVHGWGSAGSVWHGQLTDPDLTVRHRLIAVDLRGHGESDVPADGYDRPSVWADDLAAVLAHAGRPAVLVGWSYGGLVITDYLRERGTAGIAGLVLVGALTEMGRGRPGGGSGSAWHDILRATLSDDPAAAVPALTTLAGRMTVAPRSGAELQRHVGDMLRVPPSVRKALFTRDIGSADVLASVSVPTLVLHGDADVVVDRSSSEYAVGKIPGAVERWFQDVGHMPFVERRAEFNAALLEFAGPIANH
jgi:non-heme chloroperoxidase